MATRYRIAVGYHYSRYGTLTCDVYANSEEEAIDRLDYRSFRCNEDYEDDDNGGDGDTELHISDAEIIDSEEGVTVPPNPREPRDPVAPMQAIDLNPFGNGLINI